MPNPPTHFNDPILSNWQSAVASVVAATDRLNSADPFALAGALPIADRSEPLVQAGAAAAQAKLSEMTGGATEALLDNPVSRCAKAALDLALAKAKGDNEAAERAQAQLAQFGTCDPRWAESVTQFLSHYAGTAHGDVPYKKWSTLADFVLETENGQACLPAQCEIGIIGDWGTGEERAQLLLAELATRHDLALLIHLGDIYYSCTAAEADTFYRSALAAFPHKQPRIYSMCGNHDMYSGGAAYYTLLNRIGQPASFFCLRNANWQIVAADTGYNDFDPGKVSTGATWVRDNDDNDGYSELKWHQDKLATGGARRTVLLTHHQPFTLNSAIAGTQAINTRLLGQFQPFLPKIDLWLWGHEHNQVIYRPFKGVQRGRCIGASAVPVDESEDMYSKDPAITGTDLPDLLGAPTTCLRIDRATDLYNLGYAVLQLDGPRLTAKYFEYDTTARRSRFMFHEDIGAV